MEEKIVGARFTPNRIAPILWGLSAAWTAGGRLHFWLVENSEEIITALAQLVGGGCDCR